MAWAWPSTLYPLERRTLMSERMRRRLSKTLAAAHARHDQVEDDQVDPVPILLKTGQGVLSVGGSKYVVPQTGQHFRPHFQHHGLIVHQKNRTGSPGEISTALLFLLCSER